MLILAIDPGPVKSAWLIWDTRMQRIEDRDITENIKFSIPMNINLCAIEILQCFGMPVGSEVFETAYFIGSLFNRLELIRVPYMRVKRTDVKMYHCHTARAKDSNIHQALVDKYGNKGTKKAPGTTYGLKKDLWSAFAIATYAEATRMDERTMEFVKGEIHRELPKPPDTEIATSPHSLGAPLKIALGAER